MHLFPRHPPTCPPCVQVKSNHASSESDDSDSEDEPTSYNSFSGVSELIKLSGGRNPPAPWPQMVCDSEWDVVEQAYVKSTAVPGPRKSNLLTLIRGLTGLRQVQSPTPDRAHDYGSQPVRAKALYWEPDLDAAVAFSVPDLRPLWIHVRMNRVPEALVRSLCRGLNRLLEIGHERLGTQYNNAFFPSSPDCVFECLLEFLSFEHLMAVLHRAVDFWTHPHAQLLYEFPLANPRSGGSVESDTKRLLGLFDVNAALLDTWNAFSLAFGDRQLEAEIAGTLCEFKDRHLVAILHAHCLQGALFSDFEDPEVCKRIATKLPLAGPTALATAVRTWDDDKSDKDAHCLWFLLEGPGVGGVLRKAVSEEKVIDYHDAVASIVAHDTPAAMPALRFAKSFTTQKEFAKHALHHSTTFKRIRRHSPSTRALWEITGHGVAEKDIQTSPDKASLAGQVWLPGYTYVDVFGVLRTLLQKEIKTPAQRAASLFYLSYCCSAGTSSARQTLAQVPAAVSLLVVYVCVPSRSSLLASKRVHLAHCA